MRSQIGSTFVGLLVYLDTPPLPPPGDECHFYNVKGGNSSKNVFKRNNTDKSLPKNKNL